MAKVTSKLQVTVPKALADQFGIRPGDDIEWVAADTAIRLVPARGRPARSSIEERLALFDAASTRQKQRQGPPRRGVTRQRGWTREELYDRGRPR